MEIQTGSVGVLENWSIGMKAEEYAVFLFLYLALLPGPDLTYKAYLFYILLMSYYNDNNIF